MNAITEIKDQLQDKHQPQIRGILQYPDERLNVVSAPVLSDIPNDAELQNLLSDMVETMAAFRGVGLAAIQLGVPTRALVVNVDGNVTKVINPRLVEVSEEQATEKEGCLSFLGVYINVRRPAEVVVEFFDETGTKRTVAGDGLLARAIAHEIDHLDGKTMLDRVSKVERSMALEKHRVAQRRVKAAAKDFVKKQK
jgi:peptide deformylase